MEGCRVGDGDLGSAGSPSNTGRADGHINARHLEGCGSATSTGWLNLWRLDRIGTGHQNLSNPWIGILAANFPRTGKGVGCRCLPWTGGYVVVGGGPPIVERVLKLNGASRRSCWNMEGRGVGKDNGAAARGPGDAVRTHGQINTGDAERRRGGRGGRRWGRASA